MEKNKVLLTDKVTKENLKSPTFKKWIMRVLCFVCILSLALQLAMCVAPMSASAEESVIGDWVFNSTLDNSAITSTAISFNINFTSQGLNPSSVSDEYFKFYIQPSNVYNTLSYYYYVSATSGTAKTVFYSNAWADDDYRYITILGGSDVTNPTFIAWLNANATRVVQEVYDFTGEYRIFKPTLDIVFASTQTVQTYQFDFNIYGGYNADYMSFLSDADEVTMSYAFTDEGSGGLRMMYRQSFGDESGTWLVPRARIIYFQSNPDDPTFQQWLLDNTILVEPGSIDILYNTGYDVGFNDGWTNNVIGDTLKAPIDALNGMVLLQTADVTITLGGVIFTMVVLSLLIVFLKKYAGG